VAGVVTPSTLCGRVEDQLPRQHLLRYRDLERLEDLISFLLISRIILTELYSRVCTQSAIDMADSTVIGLSNFASLISADISHLITRSRNNRNSLPFTVALSEVCNRNLIDGDSKSQISHMSVSNIMVA